MCAYERRADSPNTHSLTSLLWVNIVCAAAALPRQISAGAKEDPSRRPGWAIVTSATAAYAFVGFPSAQCGPAPATFVTSDLVSRGKPAPDPYLLGAKLAGADAARCLVVEDAPPGVLAGKAAGAKVLGLKTTHDTRRQWEAGADFVCQDLSCVQAHWEGDRLFLSIEGDERPEGLGDSGSGSANGNGSSVTAGQAQDKAEELVQAGVQHS